MRENASVQRGFTLIEIIIVLAVIGILITILVPRLVIYIQDANLARAQADVNAIAAAINKMYKDTSRWPLYDDGTGKLAYTSGTDAALLTSNPECNLTTLAEAAATCDTTEPEDATTGSTWALATAYADSLTNQLITNGPAYPTSGNKAWKGPYLSRIPAVDPWGKSYYVNVANADPAAEAPATMQWVIVISAGPDGQLDSEESEVLKDGPQPADDDIVAYVK